MSRALKIKVCGLREPDNLQAVAALRPDMIGLIFYPASPRFVGDLSPEDLPTGVQRVGVFVDAPLDDMLFAVHKYGLDYVQLHGQETPGVCAAMQGFLPVIKAFRVDEGFDFDSTAAYATCADLFLFDAQGAAPGGNGRRFDWTLLAGYNGTTDYLLSGGIRPVDAAAISALQAPHLLGIDLNSGFEELPGRKSIPALTDFIHQFS
jgi:phosphoribosylanthranilate isomerase